MTDSKIFSKGKFYYQPYDETFEYTKIPKKYIDLVLPKLRQTLIEAKKINGKNYRYKIHWISDVTNRVSSKSAAKSHARISIYDEFVIKTSYSEIKCFKFLKYF